MVAVHHRLVSVAFLGLAVFLNVAGQDRAARQNSLFAPFASPTGIVEKQKLSPAGMAELRIILETGYLAELRWPDFKDRRADVIKFYDLNGLALAWVRANCATPAALALIANFENADAKGLQPEDYDASRWRERLAELYSTILPEQEVVRFDVAVTVSAMRYLSDLRVGRVNPRQFRFGFDLEKKRCDLAEFLYKRVLDSDDIAVALSELEPPFAAYHRTQRTLERYIRLDRENHLEPLPTVKTPIQPGDVYPDLARLARLLQLLGDLPADVAVAEDSVYQGPLVDGVKQFQGRHGLEPDGVINQRTVQELNTPLIQRVRQLQLTLERWRWIPHEFAQPPVVVNIPEFRLRALNEDYEPVLMTNVVVGKAYRHRTPVFARAMKQVIFRPYWNVPPSITRAELIPDIQRDRRYLAKHGYEMVAADGRIVDPEMVSDQILQQLRSRRLRVRQRPGENNALGLVKFVFPNEHDVYLHSTPVQSLFSKPRRDFSHGCIRVERAEELANWVLRNQDGWTPERIRDAMNGEGTVQINLDKPIPVLIVYSTAVVLANGEVHFFNDIYGYDAALERMLAQSYPYPN